MGKIRVKTIGDEEVEQKQQEEARRKAEAKRAAMQKKVETKDVIASEISPKADEAKQSQTNENEIASSPAAPDPRNDTERKQKKEKFVSKKTNKHSQSYKTVALKIDKHKTYSLKEALELLPELKRAKFDETVELHINTTETGVSGNVTLPHGTGKALRIKIVNSGEDPKGVEEFVSQIESGNLDFDVLIATPDSMPRLARIAKILGPKGLMPNPKNGTVTPKPDVIAKQFEGGQINFKTEAKAPIVHAIVGKISFGNEKLLENITTFVKALPSDKVVNITLKSTMSPGLRISLSA